MELRNGRVGPKMPELNVSSVDATHTFQLEVKEASHGPPFALHLVTVFRLLAEAGFMVMRRCRAVKEWEGWPRYGGSLMYKACGISLLFELGERHYLQFLCSAGPLQPKSLSTCLFCD